MYFLLFAILSLSGVYALLSGFFPVASIKSRRAVRMFSKSDTKSSSFLHAETLTTSISKRIIPLIRLSELRHVQLENSLKSSGLAETPEEFTAKALAECLLLLSLCMPLVLLSHIVFYAVIAFLIYHFASRFKSLKLNSTKKVEKIDEELCRFVSYINHGLSTNRNILLLMERYRSDNRVFIEELNRTIADIKTSNFELALLRFGARYNSEHLSMLIRGLIGIYNGDDMRYYFEMLDKDFSELELDRLRLEVKKIPKKMRKSMIVIYTAIAFLYFSPIVILISDSLRKFFS